MKRGLFILFLIFLLILYNTEAVIQLISLQGKVTNSTGGLVNQGNLTVYIYDAGTGGNLAFNSTGDFLNNTIQAGYFDVMIGSISPLNLSFGQLYYMDLVVNNENIDWDGVDRRQFQAGVGRMNASMISSGQFGSGDFYFPSKLGINKTNPSRDLDVWGSGNVSGDLYAGTRSGGLIDIAEWIKYEGEKPEEGNIVVYSSPNKIKISNKAYDINVLGIVSTKPHMTIGMEYEGEDAIKLAIVGRVPVKATIENGIIEGGNLLISSSKPGYAMKCKIEEKFKCVGAILGKALEPCYQNECKIMALINLQ